MTYRMAFLSAAAACIASLPHGATAADYYDDGRAAGFERGFERGDAEAGRFDRGPAFRPADRRGPGPVVYDERDRGPVGGGFREGGPVDEEGGPVPFGRPAFGGGRFAGPAGAYGWPARPMPGYRAAAMPRDAEAFDPRTGRPDVGCTTEQAESVTPAGWRKIVTHRTCYRR